MRNLDVEITSNNTRVNEVRNKVTKYNRIAGGLKDVNFNNETQTLKHLRYYSKPLQIIRKTFLWE